ncbi:MAG: rhomboid family intramembrane serine protease [Desulfobacterales bacterium]|nr:MAG: rhomboid family intramembrane serine protease [Desulfobacterales bacterium]
MLLIPLTDKISWRNPPIVTIFLILINCLVYFIFQFNDNQKYFEAEQYYFNSGLAEIEIKRYISYRSPSNNDLSIYHPNGKLDEDNASRQYQDMMKDYAYLEKLVHEQIITPQDPEYSPWRQLRDEYEHRRSDIVALNYGFIPAKSKPVSFLTHMFLHGGLGHLLGNMIFLWLVGCMLEMGSGRTFYSATYILAGLGSVTLFWLIYPQSPIPLVGASGAISGLMGAFTVLYCKKKVKIFYSLGFYFNYLKARAIILLPIWFANEFYQLFFGDISNVAYVAHIGGLISGAILGFINLKVLHSFNPDVLEPEPEDDVSPIIEKALRHIRQLDMESGAQLLEMALAKDPDHIDAMTYLFNVRKVEPQDPRFHGIAQKLLDRLTSENNHYSSAVKIFDDYAKLTKRPQLSADLYLKMIVILSRLGHPEKAERILAMFLKQKPDLPGIPTALLKLAAGYRQKGVNARYQRCLRVLGSKYPNSTEGQIARRSLTKPSSV